MATNFVPLFLTLFAFATNAQVFDNFSSAFEYQMATFLNADDFSSSCMREHCLSLMNSEFCLKERSNFTTVATNIISDLEGCHVSDDDCADDIVFIPFVSFYMSDLLPSSMTAFCSTTGGTSLINLFPVVAEQYSVSRNHGKQFFAKLKSFNLRYSEQMNCTFNGTSDTVDAVQNNISYVYYFTYRSDIRIDQNRSNVNVRLFNYYLTTRSVSMNITLPASNEFTYTTLQNAIKRVLDNSSFGDILTKYYQALLQSAFQAVLDFCNHPQI